MGVALKSYPFFIIMNIYLSSFTVKHLDMFMERFPDAKLNVLLSYGLKNKNMFRFIKQYRSRINSLILDSGAFTLNMAKNKSTRNKIDFMGYRDFLKRFAKDFDFVFN